MTPKRFVFHPLPASAPSGPAAHNLTANEPSIVLEEVNGSLIHGRHYVQMGALGRRSLPADAPDASPLFGDDLSLACREYLVRRIWADDDYEREDARERNVPLGNAPPRIVSRPLAGERLAQLAHPPAEPGEPEFLYLFNVIVALEWVPTPQRLRRLQWAFRRASDYLYDVTNGGMAFGQVIFAGPDWLHCADIQILASNRYLPRSWVSALLEPHKYTPIRVGRGLWVRERRIVVDWDEPEGYRSLVHEWAHYALGLKDEYMHVRSMKDPVRFRLHRGAGEIRLVDLDRSVKSESIMATVQGNSELDNPLPLAGPNHANLREVIGKRYKNLEGRLTQAWSGPGQLPLPLPHFRLAGELAGPYGEPGERGLAIPFTIGPAPDPESAATPVVAVDELAMPGGRWEIFLARFEGGKATRLSYQGEVDARSPERGFSILGGSAQDTVLFVGDNGAGHEIWSRPLGSLRPEDEAELVALQWRLRGPGGEAAREDRLSEQSAQLPRLSALMEQAGWQKGAPVEPQSQTLPLTLGESGQEQSGEASGEPVLAEPPAVAELVPLSPDGGTKAYARVQLAGGESTAVFSITGDPGKEVEGSGEGKTFDLPSLDGYTISVGPQAGTMRSGGQQLIIGDFSQGGPPRSAPSMVSDPIAAGAASGEALILCNVAPEDNKLNTDRYRVVTAGFRGLGLPQSEAKADEQSEKFVARSSVFMVSSNIKLLQRFNPSLLIVNTAPEPDEADRLRICRFNDRGGLDVLPTYLEPGVGYGIAPLQARTCEHLISDGDDPDQEPEDRHVERFVLALVPEDALRGERPAESV